MEGKVVLVRSKDFQNFLLRQTSSIMIPGGRAARPWKNDPLALTVGGLEPIPWTNILIPLSVSPCSMYAGAHLASAAVTSFCSSAC